MTKSERKTTKSSLYRGKIKLLERTYLKHFCYITVISKSHPPITKVAEDSIKFKPCFLEPHQNKAEKKNPLSVEKQEAETSREINGDL